ncbi:hypothetical protein [Granulicatella seriolae]|uniref:Uncharacterized protein n=1 Tax=Granulicatella seriolae TaxID=2967226 RepID=A0ABT1WM21_9LACT|nr:hypothetical protein [Granulicatella seriolae]
MFSFIQVQKSGESKTYQEGILVNPPAIDQVPGRDEIQYAIKVQEVLIPYTTKTDTYNYYEVRNYVNDVNQENTQILQTYDDQLKERETYTYGQGRISYLNHQINTSYSYQSNLSGSVTGLTQDGTAVASSTYGNRTKSTEKMLKVSAKKEPEI